MLKITLLKMLYVAFDPLKIPEVEERRGNDRHFRTYRRSYEDAPGIESITMEERFLPKSVLYYVWINEEKKEAELSEERLCRWIFAFAKEHCPQYLKAGMDLDQAGILDLFEVGAIPDDRKNRAYHDLTITTMDEVRQGRVKRDSRQATFPGMRFAKKYKEKKE